MVYDPNEAVANRMVDRLYDEEIYPRQRRIEAMVAEIDRLKAEVDRLTPKPAAIVQRVTGDFHLFEDAKDVDQWMRETPWDRESGYFHSMSVQHWTWHPATRKEPTPPTT